MGAYGTSVITALTAQNTLGVQGILPIPPVFVKKQLTSVLSDIGADAVKTGMLANPEVIAIIAAMVKKYKIHKLVIDPVMIAESGQRLLSGKAVKVLREKLFPFAGLITPNLSEASVLTGFPVRNLKDMKKAALALKEETKGGVLIKGGHLAGAAVDLFYDGQVFEKFSAPRIRTPHTHGTGCTFSAAVATFWAQGFSLTEALKKSKLFVTHAIAGAETIGQGRGPTNPYARLDVVPRSAEGTRSKF